MHFKTLQNVGTKYVCLLWCGKHFGLSTLALNPFRPHLPPHPQYSHLVFLPHEPVRMTFWKLNPVFCSVSMKESRAWKGDMAERRSKTSQQIKSMIYFIGGRRRDWKTTSEEKERGWEWVIQWEGQTEIETGLYRMVAQWTPVGEPPVLASTVYKSAVTPLGFIRSYQG